MYFAKNYMQRIQQNLLSASISDLRAYKYNYLKFRMVAVGIEGFLPLQSQFLYILFLSKTFPFLARKHPSKKKFRFGEIPGETAKIVTFTNQTSSSRLLTKFFYEILNKQLSPEFSAVKWNEKYTKIIAWNAPLYPETYCLQTSETTFLSDIPVYYKFLTQGNLRTEVAFWIIFFEFLRRDERTMKYLKMSDYSYTE